MYVYSPPAHLLTDLVPGVVRLALAVGLLRPRGIEDKNSLIDSLLSLLVVVLLIIDYIHNIYIYIYIYVCVYIYIYIYIHETLGAN